MLQVKNGKGADSNDSNGDEGGKILKVFKK